MNEKKFNEGNQIHNLMSSSGSDFLTSFGSGSGSTSQKVTVPTVPAFFLPVFKGNKLFWVTIRIEAKKSTDP